MNAPEVSPLRLPVVSAAAIVKRICDEVAAEQLEPDEDLRFVIEIGSQSDAMQMCKDIGVAFGRYYMSDHCAEDIDISEVIAVQKPNLRWAVSILAGRP